MKKSMKAALLSGLVFPGVGHLILKKYAAAAVLAGTTCAALYFLIAEAVEKAVQISEQIQSGKIPSDMASISVEISRMTAAGDTRLLNIATGALIIAWLIGIVDSYRVGRTADRQREVAHDAG